MQRRGEREKRKGLENDESCRRNGSGIVMDDEDVRRLGALVYVVVR